MRFKQCSKEHCFLLYYKIEKLVKGIEKGLCSVGYKNENVEISVKEITNNKIFFNTKNSNRMPYKYTNKYEIHTRVKNENYTGVGVQIEENTENSTTGFTRNWK